MQMNVARAARCTVVGWAMLTLAGCASVPESRAFNRAAHADI